MNNYEMYEFLQIKGYRLMSKPGIDMEAFIQDAFSLNPIDLDKLSEYAKKEGYEFKDGLWRLKIECEI